MDVISALVVGFLGSVHCVGMCGPLALALPGKYPSRLQLIGSRLLYNFGRTITYACLGAIIGLAGKSIAVVSTQQALSIISGVIILLMVAVPSKWLYRLLPSGLSLKINTFLTEKLGTLIRSRSQLSLFGIGLLNGLLPCGFVYIGLATAASVGTVQGASIYMLFFGFGTIPLMLATSLFGKLLPVRVRTVLTRALPVFAIILAALLILRGMSLGIKYISPDLTPNSTTSAPPPCH